MTQASSVHITLIGSGGDGIMSTANMLLRTAARMGLHGVMVQSYGPQIRGGESAAHLTISTSANPITARRKDIIACFRFSDTGRFLSEFALHKDTWLIHDAGETDLPAHLNVATDKRLPMAFKTIMSDAGLPDLAKNVLLYGIIVQLIGWDASFGQACIEEVFSKKTSAIVSTNLRAFERGMKENGIQPLWTWPTGSDQPLKVVTGNEACADAAVMAGCRFYSGYPITPSTEILTTIYKKMPKKEGVVVQAEDEISALGMVVGASYGGVPSMTATSGPGLSLMSEMLGLSSMAEIPLVIVDCQRAGPSTGLPSRTEQSDLWHAIYGGHGDFPRVVLAPVTASDCYRTMYRAFYLAEGYQLPALVLSDAFIAQKAETIGKIDPIQFPKMARVTAEAVENYRRYNMEAACECGVSPMAIPGTVGTVHNIAGIEHTEAGTPSSDGVWHHKMNERRFKKMSAIESVTHDWFHVEGTSNAPLGLIAWGSTAEAVKAFVRKNPNAAVFVPEILNPFPVKALEAFLRGRKQVAVVEMNFQGQLFRHLTSLHALPAGTHSICRSGGVPFDLEDMQSMIPQEVAL